MTNPTDANEFGLWGDGLAFKHYETGTTLSFPSPMTTAGIWYYVAIVRDVSDGSLEVYIDGNSVARNDIYGTNPMNVDSFIFGNDSDVPGGGAFNVN